MATDRLATAVLAEVAEVLARHGGVRCAPELNSEGSAFSLILRFPARELQTLELWHQLRRLVDVASIRGFAARYGIDSRKLEAVMEGTDGGSSD